MEQEWRQFRLLVRTSLGRLMDTALASRDIDGTQYAIWGFALLASPAFFYAARMMGKYSFLWRKPELLERVVPVDRLFFIVYMMLACALLAAILWEALFPDRQDQEIVGVLPVRPRTVAAARLAAALAVATLFSIAVAIPSAFMYSLNVATAFKSAPIVGWWPAVFFAHAAAVIAAGVFTFATLLALRGIAVACLGADAVQRAAAILQLVTVVLLVEAFTFLPGVLTGLAAQPVVASNASLLPPLWFLGLYSAMSGASAVPLNALAGLALAATIAAVVAATLVYLVPAGWNARRAIEAQLKDRAGRSIALAERFASPALRQPASRAVFTFVLASLARNRPHALVVATYLGFGVSVAGLRLMRAMVRGQSLELDVPVEYLLSIPLVLTFFLVVGLRAAFAVPTDLDANWTFRVAQPRSTATCIHGVAVALFAIAVLPITLLWLLVTASLWDFGSALSAAAMHAASGAMLVELALLKCEAVPFTRAHAPASSGLRAGWVVLLVALLLYAYTLDNLQLIAIESTRGVTYYVLGMLAAAGAARLYRRITRPSWELRFDAPVESAAQVLNLSGAAG